MYFCKMKTIAITVMLMFYWALPILSQTKADNIQSFVRKWSDPYLYGSRLRKLNNRTDYLIKRHPTLSKIEKLHQFHVICFYYGTYMGELPCKQEFSDCSFLDRLCYDFYHISQKNFLKRVFCKDEEYIKDLALITDSVGNLLAIGDARTLFSDVSTEAYDHDRLIARKMYDKEVDFAFSICHPSGYLCIKGEELFVLEEMDGGLKHYAWEEYFDRWW